MRDDEETPDYNTRVGTRSYLLSYYILEAKLLRQNDKTNINCVPLCLQHRQINFAFMAIIETVYLHLKFKVREFL